MEFLLDKMKTTKSNDEFFGSMKTLTRFDGRKKPRSGGAFSLPEARRLSWSRRSA
jgi:hypothetical protein